MEKRETIIKCIKKVKGNYFTQENHLVSDGWLDSIELIELVMELEEAFSLKIPIVNIAPENLDNIEEIEALIEGGLSDQNN